METVTVQLAEAESKIVSLTAEKTALEGKLADETGKVTAAEALVTTLTGEKADLQAKLTDADAKIVTLTGDVGTQTARADLAEKKLRLDPSIKHLFKEGAVTAPAGGDAPVSGAADVTTWEQAMATCKGDYVQARKQFPKIFDNYISTAQDKGARS